MHCSSIAHLNSDLRMLYKVASVLPSRLVVFLFHRWRTELQKLVTEDTEITTIASETQFKSLQCLLHKK